MVMSQIQTKFSSVLNPLQICSFEVELIEAPTTKIIHSAARFLLFKKGCGRMTINGTEYNICKNCLIAIMPWDITCINEVSEPFEFYKVVYNCNFLNGYLRTIYNPTNSSINIFNDIENNPVSWLDDKQAKFINDSFLEIRDEVGNETCNEEVERSVLSDTYIISTLVRIIVKYNRASKQGYIKIYEDEELHNLSNIFRYIDSHLQEKITLDKLSTMFFMSKTTIAKHLQLNIGFTFSELLQEMRLCKSFDLLMYSNLSLKEIAMTLGYTDASHFIKTFIAKEGVTPTAYREAYQYSEVMIEKTEKNLTFKILDYIHNHLTDDTMTAITTANHFSITLNDLNRITMFQVEKSFDNYVDWLRIGKACELLTTTDMRITDIAIEVGYNTTRTFQRAFGKIKKTSPSQFRQNVKYQTFDGKIVNSNSVI